VQDINVAKLKIAQRQNTGLAVFGAKHQFQKWFDFTILVPRNDKSFHYLSLCRFY
jgi:hypothetical protein